MSTMPNATPATGRPRSLAALLEEFGTAVPEATVADLAQDSRAVTPGAAFIAIQGRRTHGLAHVAEALARGAAAVIWESVPGMAAPVLPDAVASVGIAHLHRRVGEIADRFFGRPSEDLCVAGITGTN
ncbi:MAG TPA: Mur ligase domain-containing protein, partial [Steroidobacteraceae bacterium]|nr:Mur ligase domain-containing protein [Steroidobacteraceae bacterium]